MMADTNSTNHETVGPWAPVGLAGLCLAVIVGAGAYALSNLIQYHFLAQTGLTPEPDLGRTGAMLAAAFGDVIFSGVILVLLLRTFRIVEVKSVLVATFALFATMGAHPIAVRNAPDFYGALYSQTYVAHHEKRVY